MAKVSKQVKVTDYVIHRNGEWIKATSGDKPPFGVFLGRGEVVLIDNMYLSLDDLLERRAKKKEK